jgi:hypothetical protein
MAEIPRSLLNELTDEINALSGRAQQSASDALSRLVADWEANGNGDIAALREAAYEVIERLAATTPTPLRLGAPPSSTTPCARRRMHRGSTPPWQNRCATRRRRTDR